VYGEEGRREAILEALDSTEWFQPSAFFAQVQGQFCHLLAYMPEALPAGRYELRLEVTIELKEPVTLASPRCALVVEEEPAR
jgi:hypothetical protein